MAQVIPQDLCWNGWNFSNKSQQFTQISIKDDTTARHNLEGALILKRHLGGCFCSPQSIWVWARNAEACSESFPLKKSSLADMSRPIHTLTWAEPKILTPKHLPTKHMFQLFVQCIGLPKKTLFTTTFANLFFSNEQILHPTCKVQLSQLTNFQGGYA